MKETKRKEPLACIVLAAGQGTRMKSARSKVLHVLAGKPLIKHVLSVGEALGADPVITVIAPSMVEEMCSFLAPREFVVQGTPLGTGDAVRVAHGALRTFKGAILVLFGDTPLVRKETLERFLTVREETGAAIVVGAFEPKDPGSYGRLIVGKNGELKAIVEAVDATPEQRAIKLCNGGVMLFDSDVLWALLEDIGCANAKNEYYLTDCIALGARKGKKIMTAMMEEDDVQGINDRVQLAQAEEAMQERLREKALREGVTLRDPKTVYFCTDTVLERDVIVEPFVVFGPGVTVEEGAHIRSFSHIEGARIGRNAIVGPFARLRPGTVIEKSAHVGNFVEIKKTVLGEGAKVNHLSYVGDARIGARTNIGAGTVLCNYDGFAKFETVIGDGVFVGSNTTLVAPVSIGANAMTAAGSVVTKDVPDGALVFARAPQTNKAGLAIKFRDARTKKVSPEPLE